MPADAIRPASATNTMGSPRRRIPENSTRTVRCKDFDNSATMSRTRTATPDPPLNISQSTLARSAEFDRFHVRHQLYTAIPKELLAQTFAVDGEHSQHGGFESEHPRVLVTELLHHQLMIA